MASAADHLAFWGSRLDSPSFVYVIQGEPGTPIKVGVARDPVTRMRELQTGNPNQLRLLFVVPGAHALEAEFHRRLADARVRGEWFDGPSVEGFLRWVADFAEKACDTYVTTGHLPKAARKGTMTVRYTKPEPPVPPTPEEVRECEESARRRLREEFEWAMSQEPMPIVTTHR